MNLSSSLRARRLPRVLGGAVLVVALSTCASVPATTYERIASRVVVGAGSWSAVDAPERFAAHAERSARGHVQASPTASEDPADRSRSDGGSDRPAASGRPGEQMSGGSSAPADGSLLAPATATAEAARTGVTEPLAPPTTPAEPTRVVIPRIGVDHPMIPVGLHPDRTLVVPDRAQLAGWYTGRPRPGRVGPAVLTGHNSWGGQAGVFARLHQLVPGDEIEVHHDDGSVVRFAVERLEQHPKDAFPTERVYGRTDRREIRIITCGGVFDRNQGRHLDNVIVFGVRTA